MQHDEDNKPFVIGAPAARLDGPLPRHAPVRRSVENGPSGGVWWALTGLMFLVVVAAVTLLIGTPLGAGHRVTSSLPFAAPLWLIALIAIFALLQILPLLAAYRTAKQPELSPRDVRKVRFLCEMPMYLGLLGSLVGICITQAAAAALAAPLAYSTCITGLVLYMFARFSIELSLPEEKE